MKSTQLFSKEELKIQRSQGLQMTDQENENFYQPSSGISYIRLSADEFEKFMDSKGYCNEIRNYHRNLFNGIIEFSSTGFNHHQNDFLKSEYTKNLLNNKINIWSKDRPEVKNEDVSIGEMVFMKFKSDSSVNKVWVAVKTDRTIYEEINGQKTSVDNRYIFFK